MFPLLLAGIFVFGAIAIASSPNGKLRTEAGKNYRFFWKVTPPLNADLVNIFAVGLQNNGAKAVTISQGETETVGSHEMVVLKSQEFEVGKPLLMMGDTAVTLTALTPIA
jgi:hypothetical protein